MSRLPRGAAEACLAALVDGPMTVSQLAEDTGCGREAIRKAMSRAAAQPRPRQVHVKAWAHEDEGGRTYPRQVYALWDGPNKARPKPMGRAEIVRRWNHKRARLMRAASVFSLAVTVREARRAQTMGEA